MKLKKAIATFVMFVLMIQMSGVSSIVTIVKAQSADITSNLADFITDLKVTVKNSLLGKINYAAYVEKFA